MVQCRMNRHKNIRWKMKQLKKEQKQVLDQYEEEALRKAIEKDSLTISIKALKKVKAFLKAIEDQE